MDIFLHYILPPLVGAAIGYITNWIAVKMLFRPLYPKYIGKWRLPFTPGIIPRRKDALAKAIGRAVGEELLTKEDIQKAFCGEEKRSAVVSGLTDGVMSAAEKNMRTLSADVIAAETFEQKRDALAETLTERAVRALPQLHAGETIAALAGDAVLEKIKGTPLGMFVGEGTVRSVIGGMAERIDGYLEEHGREKLLPLVKKELYELSETPAGQLLAGIGIDRAAVETRCGLLLRHLRGGGKKDRRNGCKRRGKALSFRHEAGTQRHHLAGRTYRPPAGDRQYFSIKNNRLTTL